MKNDTHLNILMSYAYIGKDEGVLKVLRETTSQGTLNLMIDSGAFTKHNAKFDTSHINVEEYCDFLQDMGQYSEKYVMLDVIGNAAQSRSNYELMLSKSLNPMFVATMYDKDWEYLRQAVKNNADICVAGGATNKNDWMIKRFQDVYRHTSNKARMHGLGYFTFPKMLQLNLASVDASSWKTAPSRFGQTIFFNGKETRRIFYHDFINGKVKFTRDIVEILERHGVTPKMFVDYKNHKSDTSIDYFITIICSIQLQKYCKRRGLDYYLAVGDKKSLQQILYINENIQSVQYEDFLKTF